jgi:hypothetical protein
MRPISNVCTVAPKLKIRQNNDEHEPDLFYHKSGIIGIV